MTSSEDTKRYKELAEWLKLLVQNDMWERRREIIQKGVDERIAGIINSEEDSPFGRGKIVGIQQILRFEEEFITKHGTDQDTSDT